MKGENPYTGFLSVMGKKAAAGQPTYFRQGVVTAGDDKAVQKIDAGGIEYRSGENELIRANGIGLEEGDRLLLLTLDGDQTMIILAKLKEL